MRSGPRRYLTFRTFLISLGILILIACTYFVAAIHISTPEIKDRSAEKLVRKNPDKNFYVIKNNWLRKSESGLWEMYLEGDGFERGVVNGKLTKELGEEQETVFINQIKELVPSVGYLNFLKYFVAYFNRNLPDHISEEYQEEIYGVSLSASDKFDHLAPKYYRILNYHSAHDIGHALQDKNMTVGCSSFGAWNNRTEDGKLLLGRNFDFFAGEDFAKNKIVCFTKPTTGNKFMYISWAGFTGVVSGMNDKGLTITINASKSEIPQSAATPISLLAKEILQYAGNIEEAFKIARSRKTFVSESMLIGSAADHRTAIIEKSPSKTLLYSEQGEQIVCSNHFRSAIFQKDYINNKNVIESSSFYRKVRLEQLLNREKKITPEIAASILRNQDGLNNRPIGLTNEKGINQLLAHHSVIFKPEELLVWVSCSPYQLGKYVCYDLKKIFSQTQPLTENQEVQEKDRTIAEDKFLHSTEYKKFILFKKLRYYIEYCSKSRYDLIADENFISAFISSNPDSYFTYWIVGNYYKSKKNNALALIFYRHAISREIATLKEKRQIEEMIIKLENKKS